VEQHSAAGNVREVAPRDKGGIQRDSRAALDTWRTRLTDHEVERVIERTGTVASRLGIAMTGAS
jgi:hypothetical protein